MKQFVSKIAIHFRFILFVHVWVSCIYVCVPHSFLCAQRTEESASAESPKTVISDGCQPYGKC